MDLGVLLFFIVVSLAVTHPLWLNLSSHIVGCCDSWHHIWTIWWTKQALFSGNFSSPMFTDHMYFPTGTNVGFLSMHHRFVGSLLWPIFGGILTYNLLYLSNLVLAAFGAYLLVKYLTGDRRAALVSGVIFGYSAIHLQYWSYLNISTVQWFPFFALWLLKTVESPTAARGLVSGVFFVLLVLSSGYYAIAGSLFLAVFLLWHIRKVFTKEFAKASFYFVWVSVLLITPFMYVFIREPVSEGDWWQVNADAKT